MSKEISREEIRVGDKIKVTEVFTVVDLLGQDGDRTYMRYEDGPGGTGHFSVMNESRVKLLERTTVIPADAEFVYFESVDTSAAWYAKRNRPKSLDDAFGAMEWNVDGDQDYSEQDLVGMIDAKAAGKFTVLARVDDEEVEDWG